MTLPKDDSETLRSFASIADELGLPESTVKMHYYNAIRKLARNPRARQLLREYSELREREGYEFKPGAVQ